MKEKPDKDAAKNVDPLTGEPGAHPRGAGAGAGAAGGGVAGAAIGGGRSRA